MSQPIERFGVISGMITTAENLARDYGITRAEADAYAARSHQRAAAAWRDGKFGDEVVAVPVPPRRGDPHTFDQIRRAAVRVRVCRYVLILGFPVSLKKKKK